MYIGDSRNLGAWREGKFIEGLVRRHGGK